MATPPDPAALDQHVGLSDGQVAEYLRRHVDFLIDHPELLHVLTPPSRANGDNVVDIQTLMIERLRADIVRLNEREGALLASSRRSRS